MTSKKKRKAYAAVKCRYHKLPAATAVLDHAHALRNGFTRSKNVFPEFSQNNCGFYYHGAASCSEALRKMLTKHKEVTGKKVRKDNNVLFEHVVILSESRYSKLEEKYGADRVKFAVMKRLKQYAESVKKEFGFEILGCDCHFFDEGHYDSRGKFIRNIHAHVQFMNYDFENKRAPLRYLLRKGKDENGRTRSSNPHFEKMQDLLHEAFVSLGFSRGEPKSVTGREHLQKEAFVKEKTRKVLKNFKNLEEKTVKLKRALSLKVEEVKALEAKVEEKQRELNWLQRNIDSLKLLREQVYVAIRKKGASALRVLLGKADTISKRNQQHPRR